MLMIYVIVTLFGGLGWHSSVFVNAAVTSGAQGDSGAAMKAMAALLSYPEGESPAEGEISYQPGELNDYNDENRRADVYDPGDELMKALNTEFLVKGQKIGVLPEEPDDSDAAETNVAGKFDILQKLGEEIRDEQELVAKSATLMKLLTDPTIDTLPVVYVEDDSIEDEDNAMVPTGQMAKRSRYYRRYPWKRQNKYRSTYKPELRNTCNPSKEEIFKLLISLHENRKGNQGKIITFCNRKRPAKSVFTNIRFVG